MPKSFSSKRPVRMRIINELGQPVTLAAGPEQFEIIRTPDTPDAPSALLLLGLGPEPQLAADLFSGTPRIYYLEAPDLELQAPPSWHNQIPDTFHRLDPDGLQNLLLNETLEIRAHRQALRLFPSFWAPVFGRCRLEAALIPAARTLQRNTILIAGQPNGLLLKELAAAYGNVGYDVRICEESQGKELAQFRQELRTAPPCLFFSINFSGLDPYGEVAALAEVTDTRVAVWCVDNPWHLLSKLKAPFWKQLPLFVTDNSFCQGLREAGAASVEPLPLAAWPQGMPQKPSASAPEADLLFVGRSAFPGRSGFFAGLQPPEALFDKALHLLSQGQRPDFAWWTRQLGVTSLWPGKEVRLAGLCAEECAWRLRLQCLLQATTCGSLTVCGDDVWQQHLNPNASLRFLSPVDYYGSLMQLYAGARVTLNVTSLLLPHGLTQRHFDVWAAGGFLLTDATPGLDIFPEELTSPITFQSASGHEGLCDKLQFLEKKPDLKRNLAAAWRTLIAQEHTYDARLASVLEKLRMK